MGQALPHILRVCPSCLSTPASVNRPPPQTWGCTLHGEGVQDEESPPTDSVSPSFSSPGKRGDGGKGAQEGLLGGVRKRETYKNGEGTGISSAWRGAQGSGQFG